MPGKDDAFVVRRNIENFNRRLADEKDPEVRKTLQRLMHEERAKLAPLSQPSANA